MNTGLQYGFYCDVFKFSGERFKTSTSIALFFKQYEYLYKVETLCFLYFPILT